jgi:hypothetical protein
MRDHLRLLAHVVENLAANLVDNSVDNLVDNSVDNSVDNLPDSHHQHAPLPKHALNKTCHPLENGLPTQLWSNTGSQMQVVRYR